MIRSQDSLSVLLALTLLVGCGASSEVVAPKQLDDTPGKNLPAYDPTIKLEPPDADRVILELASFARAASVIAADYGLSLQEEIPPAFAVLKGNYNISELRDDPDIVSAAVNQPVSTFGSDFSFGFYEGDWDDVGRGGPAMQQLGVDHLEGQTSGRGVRVMVADTGVDPDHVFLEPRLELLNSATYLLGSVEPPPEPGENAPAYGHGTHVSGCVVQVASDVTIIPARILDYEGIGSLQDFVRALAAAMDPELRIDVLNLSVSTAEPVPLVDRMVAALTDMGIVVVAAAGNYSPDQPAPSVSPLAAHEDVIGVAAVDFRDNLASFSRAGRGVSLSAPGVAIQSCYPGDGYTTGSGTSFATPLVAGSLALIMEGEGAGAASAIIRVERDTVEMHPVGASENGRVSPLMAWLRLHPTELDVRAN